MTYKEANGAAVRLHRAAKKVITILRDTNIAQGTREQKAVEYALKNNLHIERTEKTFELVYEGAPFYSASR